LTVQWNPNRAEIPIPMDIQIDSLRIRPTIKDKMIIKIAACASEITLVGNQFNNSSGVT